MSGAADFLADALYALAAHRMCGAPNPMSIAGLRSAA
jgi:hypothetical protein